MSGALLLAFAATVGGTTELGVDVLGDDASGTARTLLAACPAIARYPLTGTNGATVAALIATHRQACPQTTIVVQVGGTTAVTVDPTAPATQALNLWTTTWLAQLQGLTFDWVEGPNDVQSSSAQNLAEFWSQFADSANGSGFKPIVGGLASGPPPRVALADGGTENTFCAALRAMSAKTFPWAWSIAARSPGLTTTVATELNSTFQYRVILSECGVTPSAQVLLSEAGRATGPWQPADLSWLAFVDGQLQLDGVMGAALFEAGAPSNPLDLTPIVSQLESYLRNPTPTDGGVPDGGADAGSPGGVAQGGQPVGGDVNPTSPKSGCSTGGPAFLILALSPALYFLRRRAR